ncbi:MAG: NAD(P)-dependent oxidoreductase [Fimbriimonadaceae bacterium]|nr:NAD(P)-dependent oxidoreductase [Alphaproteobacteria bacterium]
MTHIILTGATGYIGRSLAAALLEQGHQLTLVQRQSSDLSRIGPIVENAANVVLSDGSQDSLSGPLRDCGADVAIHLATLYRRDLSGGQLDHLIESNIRFGAQLIDALDHAGVKSFINTGSYWQKHPNRSPNGPINLYAATKAAFESFVMEAVQNRGFRAITLTLYDVYGQDDDRPKIFNLVKAASHAESVMNLSPGEQVLSFTYIQDVINGYLIALDRLTEKAPGCYEKFDLAATPVRLKDAVEMFNAMLDKPADLRWAATPYADGQIMSVNIGDLLPGWKPVVSLADGLNELL